MPTCCTTRAGYATGTPDLAPGAEHLYSNTGYNLLAELVQRVTRRPCRAWTDELFFRPLGMANTHVREDYNEVIPNRAFGYARPRRELSDDA